MATISFLKQLKKQDDFFVEHPCDTLEITDKLNYIKGLSLIANEDGDISSHEIEYLNTLVRSFHLDNNHVKGILKEIKNPTQEMLVSVVDSITSKNLEYFFILDAIAIAKADGDFDEEEKALIKQYESVFDLEKKESKELFKVSKFLHSKNTNKLSKLFESSQFLNQEDFNYLFNYYNIALTKQIKEYDRKIFNFEFEKPLIRHGSLKNATKLLSKPINNAQFTTFLNASFTQGLILLDKKNNIITAKSRRVLLSKRNKDIYFKNDTFKINKSCENKKINFVTFTGALMFIDWINKTLNTNYKITELQSDKYHNLSIDDLNKCFVENELFIKDGKYSKRNTTDLIGLSRCSNVKFEYNSASSTFRFMY